MKHCIAKSRDSDRVLEILVSRAEWLDSKGIFQWPLEWMIQQEEQIRSDVDEGLYRVCVIDGEICATYRLSSQREDYWDNKVDAMYVSKLAVAQKYSGQGLGRAIMKQIERTSLKEFIRLDCFSGSSFLGRFYQELGYELIDTVSLSEIEIDLYELKRGIGGSRDQSFADS